MTGSSDSDKRKPASNPSIIHAELFVPKLSFVLCPDACDTGNGFQNNPGLYFTLTLTVMMMVVLSWHPSNKVERWASGRFKVEPLFFQNFQIYINGWSLLSWCKGSQKKQDTRQLTFSYIAIVSQIWPIFCSPETHLLQDICYSLLLKEMLNFIHNWLNSFQLSC